MTRYVKLLYAKLMIIVVTIAIVLFRPVIGYKRALCALARGEDVIVTNRRPNIVFILADDLGWSDVGFTSYILGRIVNEFHRTPNIDILANDSLIFSDGYAPAPICAPSRASISSGQYPARVFWIDHESHNRNVAEPWEKVIPGRQKNQAADTLSSDIYTLADLLRDAGYATGHFGKWHLGDGDYLPENRGFDVSFAAGPVGGVESHFYPYAPLNIEEGYHGEYLTDRITDEAIKFISENKDNGPFYAQLWYYAPHLPLQAKPEVAAKYKDGWDPDAPHRNPIYAAMIDSLDENVGRLLEALEEMGISDNTIVIFSSDNGGLVHGRDYITSNTPLRSGKGTLWEGGVRVPFIIKWPGVTTPGLICHEPVSLMDLYPTLAEIAGGRLKEDQPMDGESLVPLLTGERTQLERDALFFYSPLSRGYLYDSNIPGAVMRSGDYKLIKEFGGELRLYNLVEDIGETADLSKDMPEKVLEMEAAIDKMLKDTGVYIPRLNPNYIPGNFEPGIIQEFDKENAELIGAWNFAEGTEGWSAFRHTLVRAEDGKLVVDIRGNLPMIGCEVATEPGWVVAVVTYRSYQAGAYSLSWGKFPGDLHSELEFIPERDGNWHTKNFIAYINEPGEHFCISTGIRADRFGYDESFYSFSFDEFHRGCFEIDSIELYSLGGSMVPEYPDHIVGSWTGKSWRSQDPVTDLYDWRLIDERQDSLTWLSPAKRGALLIHTGRTLPDNFRISAEVQVALRSSAFSGIVFNYTDSEDHHYIVRMQKISDDSPVRIQFVEYSDGRPRALVIKDTAVFVDDMARLEFVKQGSTYAIKIDDKEVHSGSIDIVSTGYAGYYHLSGQALIYRGLTVEEM